MNGMGTANATELFERDRDDIGSRSIERVSPACTVLAITSSSLCLWGAILFIIHDAGALVRLAGWAMSRILQ